MLNFKSRNLSDEQIAEKLKSVLTLCEADDFKTKKFKGLLHDYIPNETGLKARLELLGQSGTLAKVMKINPKKSDASQVIYKMALEFSQTYGFHTPVIVKTLEYVAVARDIKPDLKMATQTQNAVSQALVPTKASGNFSKKHFEKENKVLVMQAAPSMPSNHSGTEEKAGNRPKSNIILNRMAYLLFLTLLPAAYFYLLDYFGNKESFWLIIKEISAVGITHPLVLGILNTSVLLCILSAVIYKYKKYNVTLLYPVMILLIQLVSAALYTVRPELYEMIQLGLSSFLIVSFAIGAFSLLIRKRNGGFFAKKMVIPYYVTAGLFLGSQALVRYLL